MMREEDDDDFFLYVVMMDDHRSQEGPRRHTSVLRGGRGRREDTYARYIL